MNFLLKSSFETSSHLHLPTLESGINVPLRLLIFGIFSRGYGLITDLKDLILLHKFANFKGILLFFLSNFPEDTFIQATSSIPDSRVLWRLQARSNLDTLDFRFTQDIIFQIHLHKRVANLSRFHFYYIKSCLKIKNFWKNYCTYLFDLLVLYKGGKTSRTILIKVCLQSKKCVKNLNGIFLGHFFKKDMKIHFISYR